MDQGVCAVRRAGDLSDEGHAGGEEREALEVAVLDGDAVPVLQHLLDSRPRQLLRLLLTRQERNS